MDILWNKHLHLLACFVIGHCLQMTHTSSEGVHCFTMFYIVLLYYTCNPYLIYTHLRLRKPYKKNLRKTFNYTPDPLGWFIIWGAGTVNYSTIVQYKIQELRFMHVGIHMGSIFYIPPLPTKLTFTCWPWYFGQFPSSLTISTAESPPMSPSACRAEASKRRQALCRRTMCRATSVSRWPWMLATLRVRSHIKVDFHIYSGDPSRHLWTPKP